MKLILVRHGETEENALGIIQGWSVHGKLSKKGVNQAKKISEKLKETKIDVIITSDLKRAIDTAKIIAVYHPKSEFVSTKELRERNWGEFEGKKESDLDWNKIGHRHLDGFEKPKNGESIDELNNRIRNFLQNIKKRYPNNNVLVVSHDTFIRNLIRIIKETPNFKGIRNEEIYKINI